MTNASGLRYTEFHRGEWNVLGSSGMAVSLHPDGSPLQLETSWHLDDEGLGVYIRVANPSRQRLPFNVVVEVHLNDFAEPVQALIPAEEVLIGDDAQPVAGDLDLRRPRTLAGPLVAHYTRRHFANLRTSAAILAAGTRREVWFANSADFQHLSVQLATRGGGTLAADTGARSLAPGEEWRGSATLEARVSHVAS